MGEGHVPRDEGFIGFSTLNLTIICRISPLLIVEIIIRTPSSIVSTVCQLYPSGIGWTYALQYKDPPLLKAIVGPSLSQKILMTSGASPNNRARGRRTIFSNRSQIGNLPFSCRNATVLGSSRYQIAPETYLETDRSERISSFDPIRDLHLFVSIMGHKQYAKTHQE